MADTKKDKKFWVGRLLLVVLLIFSAWLYYDLDRTYRQLETSNLSFQELAEQQALQMKQYAQEVIAAKQKVVEAEQMVTQLQTEAKQKAVEAEQLMAQLRQENDALQQKVKILDKMAELEANIADLKTKNNLLLTEIERLEKENLLHPEKIKTLDEGRTLMSKVRQRVRALDRRMSEIKHEAFDAKVQSQKEMDRRRSLAGNNGFLMRNGMQMPQDIILTTEDANIKVDVKFVK